MLNLTPYCAPADYDDSFSTLYRSYRSAKLNREWAKARLLRETLKPVRSSAVDWFINRSKTQTLPQTLNRVRVYPTGEIEVRTILKNASSKHPPGRFGRLKSRGVSNRGRTIIRRATANLVRREQCQVALYTLTTQHNMPDCMFRHLVEKFLAWGRKYLGRWFKQYVGVFQLQQRGVLHLHLILFKRVPVGLWRRMRSIWCDLYGNGPNSFDVKTVKKTKRAAAYISRLTNYMTSDLGDDSRPDGSWVHEPTGEVFPANWPVGRNGEPYERVEFSGRSYIMSADLLALAYHVAEYIFPWGAPVVLSAFGSLALKGKTLFLGSQENALKWFGLALKEFT